MRMLNDIPLVIMSHVTMILNFPQYNKAIREYIIAGYA